ncbi:MAG: DEAD/DEAH box helicase [Pedosphaera sp.]|nr:DEAD/DEAH box helicase [Pedosphaera sp.]
MKMDTADFEGFDPATVTSTLGRLSANAAKRGIELSHAGVVKELERDRPELAYRARIEDGRSYEVTVVYVKRDSYWLNSCSCAGLTDCEHVYATLKQLLVEHTDVAVQALASTAGKQSTPPKSLTSQKESKTLVVLLDARLGRKLTTAEAKFLAKLMGLYETVKRERALFGRDLASLGLTGHEGWWDRVNLWPSFPESEIEFWNYLALYFEGRNIKIPEFLGAVTDLSAARDRMRRHARAQEVERWTRELAHIGAATHSENPSARIELRLRFTASEAVVEWCPPGRDWIEIKLKKMREFGSSNAERLTPEADLIWQPLMERSESYYDPSLKYSDQWGIGVLNRCLRQPTLRPFLVDAEGETLMFHEVSLQWEVKQPEDADGDYTFRLVRADGQPAPLVQATFQGHPNLYLTAEGVFTGPPRESNLLRLTEPTLIPAKALESMGGLHLLDRLRAEPPPRLAARVRTVPLRPRIIAEIKRPWAGSDIEYCQLDMLGASEDGRRVERWDGRTWARMDDLPQKREAKDHALERIERSALVNLPAILGSTSFKWDYAFSRWTLRMTKKFAEAFVPFLKSLPAGTVIDLRGELASFQNAEVAGQIRLNAVEAGIDWFDLSVLVDVNDTTLSKEEIKLLLDAKGKWVRLGSKGWRRLEFKLTEEEDKELARLGLTPHELTSEPQRLHALQLADRAARRFLPEETCARIERRAAELQARVTPELPATIKAEMRPYQLEGFHFLAYLSTNRFGGILADDMGLGKTVQTLAWLAWLRDTADGALGLPSLVVCPKSVADNWRAEVERFLPTLKVRVWSAGSLKSLVSQLGSADLHVLNYNQLRLAGDELARESFLAVILDEGQYIKNPSSLTGQIARRLRASHRLVLSGTPIENRLLDLWSLMSFAMPGALGSRAEFGRLYDAKEDPFARQRLSARVRPFLIRRTKSQVARDLPDRVEEDLFCEIEGEQKTLYRAELKRAQQVLLGLKTPKALNKERFHLLTSLLRLRQICCHPKLVKPDSKAPSAKVEALMETLEPLMEEGQKVLVFSQFVEMLDLLRGDLTERGWKYWYLAGDTENRGDLVRDFQAGEGPGVFLISLKAGGFGLNLTAASYVILFDPWWNPAVENQAIDRTHRIGQTQKVIAYRLLIKDSIEEKIRTLQRKKKGLAEDVLGEEKFSQSLSLDELRYLLTE